MKRFTHCGALALLFAAVAPGHAQTLITGTHTGANGVDITSAAQYVSGNSGAFGVQTHDPAVIVRQAAITGGNGGNATGLSGAQTVSGGNGTTGLTAISSSSIAISDSIFTGGSAGKAVAGSNVYELSGGGGGGGAFLSAPTVTIHSGTFQGGDGGSVSGSAFRTDGGPGGGAAAVSNSKIVTIDGGTFVGGDGTSGKMTNGLGGNALILTNDTNVYISGGQFDAGIDGAGTPTADVLFYQSHVTFYGHGFTFGGVSNFYGTLPIGSGPFPNTGSFTGTLENNVGATTISYNLEYSNNYKDNGSITLAPAPVPEASTVVSFGALLVLGMAGLKRKSRRA